MHRTLGALKDRPQPPLTPTVYYPDRPRECVDLVIHCSPGASVDARPGLALASLGFGALCVSCPVHLCHRLEALRCRRAAAARQGGKESAEQSCSVSDDAYLADGDDEAQEVESQSLRNVEYHALCGRCHLSVLPFSSPT